jgi:hypothetical protein
MTTGIRILRPTGADTVPIALIPDVTPAPAPTPIDDTILAAPATPPARKPLYNSALGSFPSSRPGQITGWAGVFVPVLAALKFFN